jgi:hypothetical protein
MQVLAGARIAPGSGSAQYLAQVRLIQNLLYAAGFERLTRQSRRGSRTDAGVAVLTSGHTPGVGPIRRLVLASFLPAAESVTTRWRTPRRGGFGFGYEIC